MGWNTERRLIEKVELELVNEQAEEEIVSEESLHPLGSGAGCKKQLIPDAGLFCLVFWEGHPPECVYMTAFTHSSDR